MVYRKSTKIISVLLIMIMLFALSSVFCFERAYAETDGEWQYTVVSNGVDITGYTGTSTTISVPAKVGGKTVYSVSGLCNNGFKASITTITLASGIRVLNNSVFSGYTSLKKVTLPSTLTTIGEKAFYGCTNLAAITLPNTVTSIGDSAFSNCSSLLSANLTCQATAIPTKAFENCKKLITLTLPLHTASIGSYAFSGCSALKTASIPDTVTTIGANAFVDCTNLSSVNLPNSLKTIGEAAFQNTSVSSVFIPNATKTIESSAFKNCALLTAVYISPSVSTINIGAFNGCPKLEKVVFGGDYINANNAFGGSPSLTIYYPSKYATNWNKYTATNKASYTVPSSVSMTGTLNLTPGKTSQLKIVINPSSGAFSNVYSITSSNTSVATVSSSGLVSAKSAGTTTITVTSVNGIVGTAKITVKPAAPTNVTVTPKSTSSVDLSWTKSTGATGYYIYRSTSKTGTYKKVASVIGTTYTDKGLTKGSTYYYKIVAYVNSGGSAILSAYSTAVSIKVSAPTPATITATKTSAGVATVKWAKSAGATGYEVYMATTSGGKYSKIATITSSSTLSYKKTGLTTGKTYYFAVRSYVTVNGVKVYSPFTKVAKVTV